MALDRTKMERIAGGLRQLFSYQTADSSATVAASGYFNAMTDQLRQYDIIHAVVATGGTPLFETFFVTSATGAATVTTSTTEASAAA